MFCETSGSLQSWLIYFHQASVWSKQTQILFMEGGWEYISIYSQWLLQNLQTIENVPAQNIFFPMQTHYIGKAL